MARLPPLGYSTFYLEPKGDGCTQPSGSASSGSEGSSTTAPTSSSRGAGKGGKHEKIDNGLVALEFDTETGGGRGQARGS